MRFHPFVRVYITSSAPQHPFALVLSSSFDSVGRWPWCCRTCCFMLHWLCHWVVDFHHCVMIPLAWHQNLSHLASVSSKLKVRGHKGWLIISLVLFCQQSSYLNGCYKMIDQVKLILQNVLEWVVLPTSNQFRETNNETFENICNPSSTTKCDIEWSQVVRCCRKCSDPFRICHGKYEHSGSNLALPWHFWSFRKGAADFYWSWTFCRRLWHKAVGKSRHNQSTGLSNASVLGASDPRN